MAAHSPRDGGEDDVDAFFRDFAAEAERLGLSIHDLPGLAVSGGKDGALTALLEHMRSFSPGATWKDIFPDLPDNWDDPALEETPQPYRPWGPLDYQQPPAGALVHVICERDATQAAFDRLCAAAIAEGFRIHAAWVDHAGGGAADDAQAEDGYLHGVIVFEHDGDRETAFAFWRWIQERPDLGSLTGIFRQGDEEYSDPL